VYGDNKQPVTSEQLVQLAKELDYLRARVHMYEASDEMFLEQAARIKHLWPKGDKPGIFSMTDMILKLTEECNAHVSKQ
jgi:hypothetical protein